MRLNTASLARSWRRLGFGWAISSVVAVSPLGAADLTFPLGGTNVTLGDVATEVGVRFQSMRFNPALNQWSLDLCLTNKSHRAMPGPLVVVVDSFSGTTGPLEPDGRVEVNPPKAWFDLTGQAGAGQLWPGESTAKRTVRLGYNGGAPTLTTRVFANLAAAEPGLAHVRTLDALGQPMPGVEILEGGPNGTTQSVSDPDFAQATLGGADGEHTWAFRTPGHLTVWRRDTLQRGVVSVVFSPRLTPLVRPVTLPLAGGEVTDADGSVRLQFGAGAFTHNATVSLTPLTAQTLPALLPFGWSPLQAFHLELSAVPTSPAVAQLRTWDTLGSSDTAALARWNPTAFQWDVLETLTPGAAEIVAASLPGAGSYVLVVPDGGVTAPPAAQAGRPLPASGAEFPGASTLTAGGVVNPTISLASRIPERVTATAQLAIGNSAGALPSGLPLRCEVLEQYELRDGTRRQTPAYESFLVGYQRPGDADVTTLHSGFPIRPRLLFGADSLAAATISAEVLTPTPFGGRVLDARGGQAPVQGLTLLAAPGDLAQRQAIILRRLDPTNFAAAAGLPVVAAFDLSLSGVTAGRRLALQVEGAPSNSLLVLTKVLSSADNFGLQPIERMHSDAAGRLASLEPASGERLPGLTGSGQFLVVTVPNAHGLVTGIARNSSGQPVADLPVRLTGQPWLTYSASNGAYRLIAPAGTSTLDVTDPTTGDHGQTGVTLPDAGAVVSANLSATPTGPRVVSVTPPNGAPRVSRVSPIVINFSEPLNPGTLGGNGAQLLNATGGVVTASVTLNLQNNVLTLLPVAQLAANTAHTIVLSSNLADPGGLTLEGSRQFTFTTESDTLDRVGAQVVSYEPVNGQAAMTGSPGTAEPESPVILVNETTGQTATILSKPDGSFTNRIPADVDDFLSAVLVNRNGTRNTIPVSYQIYQDGSVGVYNQGGVLEAQGEGRTVEVSIDPGAIPNRTRFKLEVVSAARVLTLASNVIPEGGKLIGPGLTLAAVGDYLRGSMDVSFPVAQAELEAAGLPPGENPTNATYALALVSRVDDQIAYLVVDKMEYEAGRLVTHSEPFPGADWALRANEVIAPEEEEARRRQMEEAELAERVAFGIGLGVGVWMGGPLGMAMSVGSMLTAELLNNLLMVPILLAASRQPTLVTGRVVELTESRTETVGTGDQRRPKVIAARPLPGALVVLKTPQTAGQNQSRLGRLDPGSLYCVSRGDGKYAMFQSSLFDAEQLFTVYASHPRRLGWRTWDYVSRSESPVIAHNIAFRVPEGVDDLLPPTLAVSHAPDRPGTNAPVILKVLSTQPAIRPTVRVTVFAVGPREGASESDVAVGPPVVEEVGATGLRASYRIVCGKRAWVKFLVEAEVASVQPSRTYYEVRFGDETAAAANPAPPDPRDDIGPQVIASFPGQGALAWALDEPIRIEFSEAIDTAVVHDTSPIQLYPGAGAPGVSLGADQRTLTLTYAGLQPATQYRLTLHSGIRDIAPRGNPLDQEPATPDAEDAFVLEFRTAPLVTGRLSDMAFGGGAVTRGAYAYVLERTGPLDGALVVYDLSTPAAPTRVAHLKVPGYPRDLALIPSYSFIRTKGGAPQTRDLLAIVGGKTGASFHDELANGVGLGQYLWVVDISNPLEPDRIAGAIISVSQSATVTRVTWSPPHLTYLDTDNDQQRIGLVNLQAFVYGLNLGSDDYRNLPAESPGKDANGDGDYVDPGDELPVPAKTRDGYAGLLHYFFVHDTDQHIHDFSWHPTTATLGVVVGKGRVYDAGGHLTETEAPPAYRTLYAGGLFLDRTNASFNFSAGEARRVFLVPNAPVGSGAQERRANLALVGWNAPGGDEPSRLLVLDITDPTAPVVLATNTLPVASGIVQTLAWRNDGLLALVTSRDVWLLDPARLAERPSPSGQWACLVGTIPGLTSATRTLGLSLAGLNVVSSAGNSTVVQTPPRFSFVSFPHTAPFAPSNLVDRGELARQTLADAQGHQALAPARFRGVAGLVSSTLSPPHPGSHYYVRVDAPGSAGSAILLCLESLDAAGRPLRDKGPGFPPVRAFSPEALEALGAAAVAGCHAAIRPLVAYRMSASRADPLYNVYLSRPFALTYEAYLSQELEALRAELDREVLWSGAFLRVGLDPKGTPAQSVLAPYAGTVAERAHQPGTTMMAGTFPADYIMGPNPPHVAGHAELPDTFGTVSAHNGEFRLETVDFVLPSRRMPIVFARAIGGQDLYEGPFGRGWDFNYNQRLVDLKGVVFPGDSAIPLVVRGGNGNEVAQERDVLFHTGLGRTALFHYAGTHAPPEFADDELLRELGWLTNAAAFYVPAPGLFDALVRFFDGRFARLEPDGTQHWYRPDGRLERQRDRYGNQIVLEYRHGELRRIVDQAVAEPRYLEVGYWRETGSGPLVLPDEATAEPGRIGKICRLRDYTGRDVLFDYSACGELKERKGIEVTRGHQDGFLGRAVTRYTGAADPVQHVRANGIRGLSAGATDGAALFTAQVGPQTTSPVLESGRGASARGEFLIDILHDNRASSLGQPGAKTSIKAPDGATAEFAFNPLALPTAVRLSGAGADPAEIKYAYDTNGFGLLTGITYPEGNSVAFTYDVGNPNLRSRANLLRIARSPGPRGDGSSDPVPEAWFEAYDDKYNFPVGQLHDFNGRLVTLTRAGDGLDIERMTYGPEATATAERNLHGQLVREISIEGFIASYEYDAATGFLTRVQRGENPDAGIETRYEYPGVMGRLGLPGRILRAEAGRAPILLEYNELGVVITRRHGEYSEQVSLDVNDNPVRLVRHLDPGMDLVETRRYLQNGFLKEIIREEIESATGQSAPLRMEYVEDDLYRLKEIRFPGGESQRFLDYDHVGRYRRMTLGGYVEQFAFDRNGNLTAVTHGGVTDELIYDGHDRVTRAKIADTAGFESVERSYHGDGSTKSVTIRDAAGEANHQARYERDGAGRLARQVVLTDEGPAEARILYPPLQVVTIDPAGETNRLTYNTAGQLVRIEDSLRTLRFMYDRNDNQTNTASHEAGLVYQRRQERFDALDRPLAVADDLGVISEFERRLDGAVQSVRNARGHTTTVNRSRLGEVLNLTRPHGVAFGFGYTPERTPAAVSDRSGQGRLFTYDHFIPSAVTFRDGSSVQATDFDPRNRRPQTVTIPSGRIANEYDPRGRLRRRTSEYPGTGTIVEERTYDALARVRQALYPAGEAAYEYHAVGPLRRVTRKIGGLNYQVAQQVRKDGVRVRLDYPAQPAAVSITETRDLAGRLRALAPAEGPTILEIDEYANADQPGVEILGENTLLGVSLYDLRKRLVRRAYLRPGQTNPLVEVRYAYDATDNVVARQWVHRAARTDFFEYDAGNRLTRADHGARPRLEPAVARAGYPAVPVPLPVSGAWAPGYFGRAYTYDLNGLDLLLSAVTVDPDQLSPPPFAAVFADPDALLHLQHIDGFFRSRDPLGNATRQRLMVRPTGAAGPIQVGATLRYSGDAQLCELVRDDHTRIAYLYDDQGLCCYRVLSGDAAARETAYIYHNGLLLAEYDRSEGRNELRARYYYGDGDVPLAGDLRGPSGRLDRYYALLDALGSVLGLVDTNGVVVERYDYDAWGQPVIELADATPPTVRRVVTAPDGIYIEFTERILPPALPAPPETLMTRLRDLEGAVSLTTDGVPAAGSVRYLETLAGYSFGTVLHFQPDSPLTGACVLTVQGGRLIDEWNNPNPPHVAAFRFHPSAGTLLYRNEIPGATGPTGPRQVARSSVGWPFLFHGQYLDYDAGLIYMRARFYDPSSGLFLQPDPMGYEDSVNLYAAFGHNPTSARDPTGLSAGRPPRDFVRMPSPTGAFKPPRIVRWTYGPPHLRPATAVAHAGSAAATRGPVSPYIEAPRAPYATGPGLREVPVPGALPRGRAPQPPQAPVPRDVEVQYWRTPEPHENTENYAGFVSRRDVEAVFRRMDAEAQGRELAAELPALAHARATQRNLQGHRVSREYQAATGHEVFVHEVYRSIPDQALAHIVRGRSLRYSDGVGAHYGPGVYAWGSDHATSPSKTWVKFTVQPGTAIEKLTISDKSGRYIGEWYRLIGDPGQSSLRIRIKEYNPVNRDVFDLFWRFSQAGG